MNIENKTPTGSLRISSEVLITVARQATLEVEGVSEVTTGAYGVKRLITKTNYTMPIKVDIAEDTVSFAINIVVESGRKIPDIAVEIQRNVKEAVENMTSLKVDRVNVIVVGISGLEQENN